MLEFYNRRPPETAAVVFVELPSANRKAAAVTRRLFYCGSGKKRMREILPLKRQRKTPKECSVPKVSRPTIRSAATII
jgi:hypothetical protein